MGAVCLAAYDHKNFGGNCLNAKEETPAIFVGKQTLI